MGAWGQDAPSCRGLQTTVAHGHAGARAAHGHPRLHTFLQCTSPQNTPAHSLSQERARERAQGPRPRGRKYAAVLWSGPSPEDRAENGARGSTAALSPGLGRKARRSVGFTDTTASSNCQGLVAPLGPCSWWAKLREAAGWLEQVEWGRGTGPGAVPWGVRPCGGSSMCREPGLAELGDKRKDQDGWCGTGPVPQRSAGVRVSVCECVCWGKGLPF